MHFVVKVAVRSYTCFIVRDERMCDKNHILTQIKYLTFLMARKLLHSLPYKLLK
jgi:hypothetical protein